MLRDMIDSVLGPENMRNHLGEGVLTFKVALMEWRQRPCSAGPNTERRLRKNAEGMRKKPWSVWGPLEQLVSRFHKLFARLIAASNACGDSLSNGSISSDKSRNNASKALLPFFDT